MKINPIQAIDFYKAGHKFQYPEGTEVVYSNFTPRSDRLAVKTGMPSDGHVVWYGLQGFIKWFLIDAFNEEFFYQPKHKVVADYKKRMDTALVTDFDVSHIEALHDLGYLPIIIKALPEGSLVGMKTPVLTIQNTLTEFFWLTNYIESVMSAELWKATTSATTAYKYREILQDYAIKTGSPLDFVLWQGHDFSFRGAGGLHDAAANGSGHLLSFLGTDTIPAMQYLEDYYSGDETFVGGSVAATEHSVMCMGSKDGEEATFRRLVTDIYPSGVVSIVSDTWDFWNVISVTAAKLKPEIMARTPNAIGLAKVVFRPDSGDPVKILTGYDVNGYFKDEQAFYSLMDGCPNIRFDKYSAVKIGDKYYEIGMIDPSRVGYGPELRPEEVKGAVGVLWDIFGGTITETGHKLLDSHVGLIYGDSITLDRAQDIMSRLAAKGYASGNVVFGIGSFTYQYVTRDTYGFAVKSTYGEINGEAVEIFKDPVTDNGVKKSAKGLLRVDKVGVEYVLSDQQTKAQAGGGELKVVYWDGEIKNDTLANIRARIEANLAN